MTDPLNFEEAPPTAQEEAEHPEREHQRPVAWLFGRQLVRSLKYTLIYTAFGEKLDPRDWMNPRAYTFAGGGAADASPASSGEGAAADVCPAPWTARTGETAAPDEGDFWFDYLSDTGDGTKAVYSLAYLCMSDLWVKDPGHRQPALDDSFLRKAQEPGLLRLPRGSFLMVGGDTAYHMSDYATLHERFQLPFRWAFEDLRANVGAAFDERRRPIFGIPGNHDYYDQLDGFRRQFRRTVRPEPDAEPADLNDYRNPQLLLSGFARCQEASYVALELPHGWWLWGLDTEVGTIDVRQRKFFLKLASESTGQSEERAGAALDKLIVATCAPTTVFGKFPDRDDEKSSRAFFQLGLPRPFIERDKLERDDEGNIKEPLLRADQCRLDISGDVHHYARYWGPAEPGAPRVRDGHRPDRRPASVTNYASVVSGIGGAFHHPTTTYKGEIEEHALYPTETVSRHEVSKQVFRFWNLINGGGVWLVGFLITFILYCGLTFSQSSRQFVLSAGVWERLHLFRQEAVTPTVPVIDQGEVVQQFLAGPWPVPDAPTAGICGRIQAEAPGCARGCYPPRYFLGACAIEKPDSYWVGVGLTLLSLALVIATFILAKLGWLFADPDKDLVERMQRLPAETEEKAEQPAPEKSQPGHRRWYEERPFRRVVLLAVPTIVVSLLALLILRPFRPHLTPFGNSMMVLVTLIWAAGAVALSVRYSEWLFTKASMRKLARWDWAVTWALGVFAVVVLTSGLWVFGQNNRAANLVADIIFALVVLTGFLGVVALGYFKAGEMKDGYLKKAPYLVLGLIHSVLQIATAFLIVRKGALPAWLPAVPPLPRPEGASVIGFFFKVLTVAAVDLAAISVIVLPVVVVFGLLGWLFMRNNRRWLLFATWVAHGALLLLLPWLTWRLFGTGGGEFIDHQGLLPGTYNEGWWGLLPALLAGLLGAVLCCIWLGWYFAVSLTFHGHNNEIAGAARIERFKQFVRVRVNKDGLTGYVIAIDYPKRNGKDLRPRLVDVFHICGKP